MFASPTLLTRVPSNANVSSLSVSYPLPSLVLILVFKINLSVAYLVEENKADSQLFFFEPSLITHLTEMLSLERQVPFAVQTSVLSALEALSFYRNRLNEILTGLNAGANHGALMFLLRRVASNLDSDQRKRFFHGSSFIFS
jgi:E3 ubiquitin-protein ligase HUWE1